MSAKKIQATSDSMIIAANKFDLCGLSNQKVQDLANNSVIR